MKRIIAISICLVFVLSASMVPRAQEPQERMTFEEFKEEVRDLVVARNAILLYRFNKGHYNRMARKFTPQARIKKHDEGYIAGKNSGNYWLRVSQIGRNLQFELESLEFETLPVSDPYDPEAVNYVAYEVTKFSFEGASSGKIIVTYRHRVMCEID